MAWSRGHHHGRHDGFWRSRLITVSEIQTLAGILFTCLPHNWDQGLFCLVDFYFIFSSRTSIGLIVYPASPVPSPSTWLRSTSSSCDAFPCEHAKTLFIMGSSSQVHRFTGVGAAVADRYCCSILSASPSASTHRKKLAKNTKKIPKKSICFRTPPPPPHACFYDSGPCFCSFDWRWLSDQWNVGPPRCHDALQL